MPTVKLEPEAYVDIAEAQDWYQERQPGLEVRFARQVDLTLNWIRDNVGLCREVQPGVRKYLMNVFPYTLYFKLKEDEVRVVAIVHVARDPEVVWKRL